MTNSMMTRVVKAKTADYTCVPTDGTVFFTNRGASGTVIFTLPTSTTIPTGWWAEFVTCAAQSITVASAPADTLIVHADLTADTITTAATIGQHIRVTFDGTGFFVQSDPSVATTATAVTAVTLAS